LLPFIGINTDQRQALSQFLNTKIVFFALKGG